MKRRGSRCPVGPSRRSQPATQAASLATGCLSVAPLGIVGTPAIDLATRLIVFNAVTGDTSGNISAQTIQAWSIDDPAHGPVWALNVSTQWPNFQPQRQLQRSAVLIVNGIAYVGFGSFNDCEPYNGWVVGVPVANPSAAQAFMTPVVGAGIWGPGGPASDGTSVFAVTGNRRAEFDLDGGPTWAGSSAVFRFGPTLTFSGNAADYYVPPNWDELDRNDEDLGSSGPLVVDAPVLTPSALRRGDRQGRHHARLLEQKAALAVLMEVFWQAKSSSKASPESRVRFSTSPPRRQSRERPTS